MGGTKEGGRKVAVKLKKSDPEFYIKIGKLGGRKSNKNKGFGTHRELAEEAGRKGGVISRRSK